MAGKRCLSIKAVARRLGVHDSTVYRLVREGELPGFKVGGQWRFSEERMESWIEGRVAAEGLKAEPRRGKSRGRKK